MKVFWTDRFEGYCWKHFYKDFVSGSIVGIIAVPLAMAFAIASGVKPEYGIYTAFVASILISLFGGSKFQIGGPTGAFVPILFGIIVTYGYADLLFAGFLAGILLIFMGIFKFGTVIKFIPRPVTIGFTSGIAIIIFTGQIPAFLGLTKLEKHEYFISNINEIIKHLYLANLYNIFISLLSLFILLIAIKLLPKIPSSLLSIIGATMISTLFFANDVATIGSTFGKLPSHLPALTFPEITFDRIQRLIIPAFVIATLGGIESLLSAVVADGMTNSKHNSNRELIGQGIANIITPLFGGIPATGAIARTATNIKSGAVSPISGIIHGLFVLLSLLIFAPLASLIPLASMAPILMLVAWNMSERKEFIQIVKLKSGDSLVLVVTFLLTVFSSITFAVIAGLILAVFLFMKRMSDFLIITKVLPDQSAINKKVRAHVVTDNHDCPQINIFTIEGPLFFGSAQLFEQKIMKIIHFDPAVIVLRMGKVPFMDSTGEAYFKILIRDIKSSHSRLILTGVKKELEVSLKKSKLYDEIGDDNFFPHTGEAINEALHSINYEKCIGCQHFAFQECTMLSNGERPNNLQ